MKTIAATALLALSLSLATATPVAPARTSQSEPAHERIVCQALAHTGSPAALWALFGCERR